MNLVQVKIRRCHYVQYIIVLVLQRYAVGELWKDVSSLAQTMPSEALPHLLVRGSKPGSNIAVYTQNWLACNEKSNPEQENRKKQLYYRVYL